MRCFVPIVTMLLALSSLVAEARPPTRRGGTAARGASARDAAPRAGSPRKGAARAAARGGHHPRRATARRGRHTPSGGVRHPARRRPLSPQQLALYQASVARWQEVPPGLSTTWQAGMRDIVFYAVNSRDRAVVRLFRPDGSLDPEGAGQVRHLAGDRRTNTEHDLDPRLLALLYRLVVQLDAPQISVISGYRAPRGGSHSHHGEGRAIDIIVPGVDPERVAQIARGFGHVGVGTYPTSGFVHIDVRDQSYFWVDRSGPGQRGRVRQVRQDEARASDAAFDPLADRIQPRLDDRGLSEAPSETVAVSEPADPAPRVRMARTRHRHRPPRHLRPGRSRTTHR